MLDFVMENSIDSDILKNKCTHRKVVSVAATERLKE